MVSRKDAVAEPEQFLVKHTNRLGRSCDLRGGHVRQNRNQPLRATARRVSVAIPLTIASLCVSASTSGLVPADSYDDNITHGP